MMSRLSEYGGKMASNNSETSAQQVKYVYNPMMQGVRWTEKYARDMEKLWKSLPYWMSQLLATVAVFLLASGLHGDWILIVVHFLKQMGLSAVTKDKNTTDVIYGDTSEAQVDSNGSLIFFITTSCIGSYAIYFGIGGFLHWYFYVKQRGNSHEWKCQPEKFLPSDVELHEILLGSCSLFCVNIVSGCIAWHVANDGTYLTIYYKPDEYGWLWFFLQTPVLFVYQDYAFYITHRLYHLRFLYTTFHKMHHKYKQPTVFAATAAHPIEVVHLKLLVASPMFFIPVHWILLYAILLYVYYHAIIDHSGIAFKAKWWQPWQPDAIFHDNHHQYTHVNFGLNMYLWDKLHGTYRQKNRVYSKDILYGKVKTLD